MFQAKVWPASVGKVHQNEQQTKSRNKNLTQIFFWVDWNQNREDFLEDEILYFDFIFFGETRRLIYYQQNGSFRRKNDGDQVIHSYNGFSVSELFGYHDPPPLMILYPNKFYLNCSDTDTSGIKKLPKLV